MIHRLQSDRELWDAIAEDDIKAFNSFFDRHWQSVYSTVFAVVQDTELASQAVNDIFLNLWLKRKYLNITFFKTYLTASARYHVYRHIKATRKSALVYVEDFADIPSLKINNKAEEDIYYYELMEHVENNLQVLPDRCKEIFSLSRKEHLSNDEIAERLDISKRTVENQLTRALHHLRISLKYLFSLAVPLLLFLI